MTDKFRPMLADNKFCIHKHGADLQFPLYISPKLDGIRIVLHADLGPVTRSLKPIRNKAILKSLTELMNSCPESHWLDGEIIVGDATHPEVYNKTSSGVQSFDGEPDWRLYIFDKWLHDTPYEERIHQVKHAVNIASCYSDRVYIVRNNMVDSIDALLQHDSRLVDQGFEGTMLRHPQGLYKFGRSTLKQQWLLKVKRWTESEAEVIGFEERMQNNNQQTYNELGYAERSSHKENMAPTGLLGVYKLRVLNGPFKGVECEAAPAEHTHDMLKEVWENSWQYLGKVMTFTYFEHGAKDKPRFPRFLRWRNDSDFER